MASCGLTKVVWQYFCVILTPISSHITVTTTTNTTTINITTTTTTTTTTITSAAACSTIIDL